MRGLPDLSDAPVNTSGGIYRGATYNPLNTPTSPMATQPAFGWEAGTNDIRGLWINQNPA